MILVLHSLAFFFFTVSFTICTTLDISAHTNWILPLVLFLIVSSYENFGVLVFHGYWIALLICGKLFPQPYLLGALRNVLSWSVKVLVFFLKVQGLRPGMVLNVPPLDFCTTPLDCCVIGKVDENEVCCRHLQVFFGMRQHSFPI